MSDEKKKQPTPAAPPPPPAPKPPAGKILLFGGGALQGEAHTTYQRAKDGEDLRPLLRKGGGGMRFVRMECKKGTPIQAKAGHEVPADEVLNAQYFIDSGLASIKE